MSARGTEVLKDDAISERIHQFSQLVLNGDFDGAHKVAVTIPIPPSLAKNFKSALGKDYILSEGYDLSWANA